MKKRKGENGGKAKKKEGNLLRREKKKGKKERERGVGGKQSMKEIVYQELKKGETIS